MSHAHLRTVTAGAAILCALAPAVPAGAQTPAVSQGDVVSFTGGLRCTIGYNDAAQGLSYTAGHCATPGARATVEKEGVVYSGTFRPSLQARANETGNDWGLISWDEGVRIAGNDMTGNTVLDPAQVRKGERVCSYGAASRRKVCGAYAGHLGNNVYWDAPNGINGDSGGPVWVDGKGFLAVYSGGSHIFNGSGGEASLARGTQPINGPAVSVDDEIALIAATKTFSEPATFEASIPGGHAALATAKLTARAQEKSSESKLSANSASSTSTALPVVLAVLVGALIASLPAIAQAVVEIAPHLLR